MLAAIGTTRRESDADRLVQIYLGDRPVYGFVDRSTVETIRLDCRTYSTFLLKNTQYRVRVFAHGDAELSTWEWWARGTLDTGAQAGRYAAAFGRELDDDEPVLVIGVLDKKTWTHYEAMRSVDELIPEDARSRLSQITLALLRSR